MLLQKSKFRIGVLATVVGCFLLLSPLAQVTAESMANNVPGAVSEGGLEKWVPRAEAGEVFAMYVVGYMYSNGENAPRDVAKGLEWHYRAAERGYAPSKLAIANMYLDGDGVAKDRAKALAWYERAAKTGYVRAQANLAAIYLGNEQFEPDYARSFYWFRQAAAQGDDQSRYNLGLMHSSGWGVPKRDYVAAYALLVPLGERGHEQALTALSQLRGLLSEADYSLALNLAERWRDDENLIVMLEQYAALSR